ncbi:glycoside hydrolase family 9 protein [Bacteroidota bacterium]
MRIKNIFILFFLIFPVLLSSSPNSWIRINQLGYLENSIKIAVLISKEELSINSFEIKDALTDKTVFVSEEIESFGELDPFKSTFRLVFTEFNKEGSYYIETDSIRSPNFRIANDVYNGTADFLLRYMRQQRCGYNPFLKDSCHTHDGFIIYHPELDSTHINVIGGWHDASDCLQYVTSSANATFQMLFAYEQNPDSFGDNYDKNGDPGSNGIPDILDEAKWGLDWLVKMNPKNRMMFNQIADDRDHAGFRHPSKDSVDYGKGLERPVYFCTGEPQGVFEHKNRTEGIASTAGKYASTFIMGAKTLEEFYPEFSDSLKSKSIEAYKFGLENPGVCQTAPCRAPYYYKEDNWVDDMELAAVQHYLFYDDENYLNDAVDFGRNEQVTPWMGSDTAKHYQWYPFLNLGHYYLAKNSNELVAEEFTGYLKKGINKVFEKGKNNPFFTGIPFIWCSNNLVSAMLTQIKLYSNLTGDTKYNIMEAMLRDWLFGCNPWGTSMIVGLPEYGDYPEDTHSSLSRLFNYKLDGGLVDGPVYASIFNNLRGLVIYYGDEYEEFQLSNLVYHDDYGDYSTNEPTMDGTASLSYYLSSLEAEGNTVRENLNLKYDHGAITRTDKNKKEISLVFTGHEFADGGDIIVETLNKHKIKAGFFFTGDFYRNPDFESLIYKLKDNGHYLGAHSDKHLLYADWGKRDSLLVTKQEFINDLKNNYLELEKFSVLKEHAEYYLPPFEWYNQKIYEWTDEVGLVLINYTPGTYSGADYTTPNMGKRYLSSEEIYKRVFKYEKLDPDGLNGFILLIHIGTDPRRTDKFYNKLDELIVDLTNKGYQFKHLTETIK